LTEVLYEGAVLEEALRNTRLENLDLLPCGAIPPNPSETLGSSRMKDLVQNLRERYDVVLFDSPPVLAVTDPAVLATLSDGVVMVASAGNTRVEALERAVEVLKGVGARLLGIVLNNFDLKRAYGGLLKYKEYEYGYGYTYGSNGNGVSSGRVVGKP
jgi:capsular exopolysaccharide synthesis family protein